VAPNNATTLAAKAATSTIPIVCAVGMDPVQSGLVARFNRPGGNIAGVVNQTAELMEKRLEFLRELLPWRLSLPFVRARRVCSSMEVPPWAARRRSASITAASMLRIAICPIGD
jgi:hypothetical protein